MLSHTIFITELINSGLNVTISIAFYIIFKKSTIVGISIFYNDFYDYILFIQLLYAEKFYKLIRSMSYYESIAYINIFNLF